LCRRAVPPRVRGSCASDRRMRRIPSPRRLPGTATAAAGLAPATAEAAAGTAGSASMPTPAASRVRRLVRGWLGMYVSPPRLDTSPTGPVSRLSRRQELSVSPVQGNGQ
jgi:hypothetical protein